MRGSTSRAALSAWLHIAGDGTVTAYTGKVELGQNVRTSLSQAVAEELHVGIDRVHLVMGDTALVPFDNGTFASLTTPTMGLQLRKAAAVARERLLDRAAETWKVERGTLTAAGGKIEDPKTGKSFGYGELTGGQEFVETIGDDTPLAPPDRWQVAGHDVPKVGAAAFVTGRHKYASDLKRPGMAHGKVLRPPSFGATLDTLDTSAAQAMAGVLIVRDGEFVGVVAPDEATAERALAALRAAWKTIPGECNDRDVFAYLNQHKSAAADPSRLQRGSIADGIESRRREAIGNLHCRIHRSRRAGPARRWPSGTATG